MEKETYEDLRQLLETQREKLGTELNRKAATFKTYNNKIGGIKEEFQRNIQKNIHDSENNMMYQLLESREKQVVLAAEAKQVTKQYESVLAYHLDKEKILLAKRRNTEVQLQMWLTKYDQNIGEKQIKYEKLKQEYDKESAALDDLNDRINDQEKEYITLMEAKREEEEQIYQEMAYRLLLNRCAKIIQRAWRAYRERRAKRKGKKGKKKKGR